MPDTCDVYLVGGGTDCTEDPPGRCAAVDIEWPGCQNNFSAARLISSDISCDGPFTVDWTANVSAWCGATCTPTGDQGTEILVVKHGTVLGAGAQTLTPPEGFVCANCTSSLSASCSPGDGCPSICSHAGDWCLDCASLVICWTAIYEQTNGKRNLVRGPGRAPKNILLPNANLSKPIHLIEDGITMPTENYLFNA